MFSKSQLDAYKNMKAPDELRDKVINAKPRKHNIYWLPLAISFAACLVLIFSVAVRSKEFTPTITVFGEELSSSVTFNGTTAAVSARKAPVVAVPVTIDAETKTEIKVSSGSILVKDSVYEASATIDSYTELIWEVPLEEEFESQTMTLTSGGKTAVITLTQDKTDGSFTASIN